MNILLVDAIQPENKTLKKHPMQVVNVKGRSLWNTLACWTSQPNDCSIVYLSTSIYSEKGYNYVHTKQSIQNRDHRLRTDETEHWML